MKRRLLIAKALVHSPKLLFLDEPTAGVDVELRRDLWNYVRQLQGQGTTVVLTTHYLEEAEELADRVGIIDQGKLLIVEEKASLLKRLGERVLEVTLKQPLVNAPEAIGHATKSDDGLKLKFTQRPDASSVSHLLQTLYAAGAQIEEVHTSSSSLEDILLKVLHRGANT